MHKATEQKILHNLDNVSDIQLIQMASAVDDYGRIVIASNDYVLWLTVVTPNEEVTVLTQSIFGGGKWQWGRLYVYSTRGNRVSIILQQLLPYIIANADKANLAIEYASATELDRHPKALIPPDELNLMKTYCDRMQELEHKEVVMK